MLRDGEGALGCVGVRLLSSEVAELTSLFVREKFRRCGAGRALVAAAEDVGCAFGAQWIRLDTRSDLTESRALYAASGFAEVNAYNEAPYAQHWFEKALHTDGPGRS